MFPVFIAAALAVPVVAAVAAVGAAVRHFEGEYSTVRSMQAWARARAFSFHPEWHTLASALQRQVPGISRAWAGFRGEVAGASVFGACCTWETGGGQSSTSHRRDVRAVRIEGVNFPTLVVYRRWRTLVMRPLMAHAPVLDVEHHGFSRRWEVACPSQRLAHDLLHPRVLELLLQAPRWVDALWFDGDAIVLVGRGGTPERTDQALELLAQLAALVPHFSTEELGEGAVSSLYGQHTRRARRATDNALPWRSRSSDDDSAHEKGPVWN
ncbi:hypothetical protein [Tessaracoccus antarcticus]|uniref:Secreted protein n=1 Tax=Tessaracoccus antarcticus TaxID=2479848 RepID=A0A3M0GAL6_9ACTN|nr:hypothetical protein [Tessaracoccus antarcticus]RMB61954.1 hypothetical protein EAX62_05030 [Tessaracoccus antarcticus]